MPTLGTIKKHFDNALVQAEGIRKPISALKEISPLYEVSSIMQRIVAVNRRKEADKKYIVLEEIISQLQSRLKKIIKLSKQNEFQEMLAKKINELKNLLKEFTKNAEQDFLDKVDGNFTAPTIGKNKPNIDPEETASNDQIWVSITQRDPLETLVYKTPKEPDPFSGFTWDE